MSLLEDFPPQTIELSNTEIIEINHDYDYLMANLKLPPHILTIKLVTKTFEIYRANIATFILISILMFMLEAVNDTLITELVLGNIKIAFIILIGMILLFKILIYYAEFNETDVITLESVEKEYI